jgi:hypothetical protein
MFLELIIMTQKLENGLGIMKMEVLMLLRSIKNLNHWNNYCVRKVITNLMKISIIIIFTLILYSCQKSNNSNEISIPTDTIIKKERIIRYKLLPHKPNINPPFSKNRDDDDIFYTYYSLDGFVADTNRLPTLRQFQGYKITETNLTGDTIKTYVYNTYATLIETKITISNDSIKFIKSISPSSESTSTLLTYTANNIKKELFIYESGLPSLGGCGWIPELEWDNITHIDSNNNPITTSSSIGIQSFKYNSKYNIIYYDFIELSTGKILTSTTFSYNTNNQLIEENHGDNFSMVNKTVYEYKNDTLTQAFHYDIDNNLIFSESTTYHYDNFGNWIKKTESINSIPRFITKRQVSYYN